MDLGPAMEKRFSASLVHIVLGEGTREVPRKMVCSTRMSRGWCGGRGADGMPLSATGQHL